MQCKWFFVWAWTYLLWSTADQGTILCPLLILIYINDLTNCLKHCTARLYADDTSLNTSGSHIKVIEPLMNADLKHVSSWLIANKLTLNVIKTVYMVVGSKQRLATLKGEINLQINSTSLKKGTRYQMSRCPNWRKSYVGKTRWIYNTESCV